MIDERKLIAKLEHMAKESKEASGLKEPALLQKIIEEVKDMAVNEEIKARIEREDAEEPKLIDAELAELVDRQPAVGSAWIPVSERLPEDNEEVLVTISGPSEIYTSCDCHNPDGGGRWDASYGNNVIAWMPLPEPYREEIAK